MPRRPRVHLDHVPLHVVQRGHNREPCFFREIDYLNYLHCLDRALAESGCQLHAYVLMTNHVHMLLTPSVAAEVPRFVISLGRRYVQHINRSYGRTGTLWDSRYKASLVQTESYLLACQRYIELNPVRAGMVQNPGQYRWSSYRRNALAEEEPRIAPHPVYESLGATRAGRAHRYRALFDLDLEPAVMDRIRGAARQNQAVGDPGFHSQLLLRTGTPQVARPRGRPRKDDRATAGP